MTDTSSAGPRERLLDAAEQLIYAASIHGTGVDAIVRQSGTARKSFYTYFSSKEDLIAAALRRRDQRWMNWFEQGTLRRVADGASLAKLPEAAVGLVILPLEEGFATDAVVLLGEQDILGDRLARAPRRRRSVDEFITEAASLSAGDLVVHAEHGIGRYEALETIQVGGAPHDCLKVLYAGDDRLFVPVEDIEVLSRYGSEEAGAQLDRLGGVAWQSRKARVKRRIREIAGELIRIAAERQLRPGETLAPPEGLYEEFAARYGCDRFTATVLASRYGYIVEHMCSRLLTAAFSPILRDFYDFAATLTSPPPRSM